MFDQTTQNCILYFDLFQFFALCAFIYIQETEAATVYSKTKDIIGKKVPNDSTDS